MGSCCARRAPVDQTPLDGEEPHLRHSELDVVDQTPLDGVDQTPLDGEGLEPIPSVRPYRPGTTSMTEPELCEIAEDDIAELEVRWHALDELNRRASRKHAE